MVLLTKSLFFSIMKTATNVIELMNISTKYAVIFL